MKTEDKVKTSILTNENITPTLRVGIVTVDLQYHLREDFTISNFKG